MAAPRRTLIPPQWTVRVWSLLLAAAAFFFLLCLLSYNTADISLLSSDAQRPAENLGGAIGSWLGFIGRTGFGWASLLIPVLLVLWAARLWRNQLSEVHSLSVVAAGLCLLSSVGTLLALAGATDVDQTQLGGVVGFLLGRSGQYYLGGIGTVLAACSVVLLAWLVVSGQTFKGDVTLLRRAWDAVAALWRRTPAMAAPGGAHAMPRVAVTEPAPALRPPVLPQGENAQNGPPKVRLRPSTIETKQKVIPTPMRRQAPGGFQLPPLDLLATPPPLSERKITEDLQANARRVEETLHDFNLEARVTNIDRGPTVTRYELTPSPGMKLTKFMSLSDDLALALKAASCHVVAPIPGRGTVGVDVPNSVATTVYLKEIITAHEFTGNTSPLALPLGKDVSGNPLVVDLRDCPHLLIAGATGSGKTVCLNSLLIGMLMHASPEQVKFIMIDPKMVEMAMFNNIPHLACPVVTGSKKASVVLHWAVKEMDRRYQLLAAAGVRNIDLYNKRTIATRPVRREAPVEAGENPEDEGPLPYLVIVVDELADLMMVAQQDVEGAITRLAQLSRAVGIHMILATQRPSVDIITGVIKANFPARMAFQVASKVDSRTILDCNGADKLVGRGDLLFLRPGSAKPTRAQGAFLSDVEIEAVTNYLKQQGEPEFDQRLIEHQQAPEGAGGPLGEKDEMYEMAKQLVLDTGQASTSLLQRRLRLGYGRAARILDIMEQEGIVGPPQGSRPREILINRDPAARGAGS